MTVASVQLQTHKLSRKKTVKVLVVDYSGALEPGSAQVPGNYQLVAAGKGKKLGTRAEKTVAIASATYNPAAQSVTLTLAGKLPSGPLQLTIIASAVLDAEGRALDGKTRSARRQLPDNPGRLIDGLGGPESYKRIQGTNSVIAVPVDAPLAASRPGAIVTCTLPLRGFARVIVTDGAAV